MESSTHWVLCCGLCGWFLCSDNIYANKFSVFPRSSFFSVPAPPYAFLLWHFVLSEYHIPSLPTTWPARISIQLQLPSNLQTFSSAVFEIWGIVCDCAHSHHTVEHFQHFYISWEPNNESWTKYTLIDYGLWCKYKVHLTQQCSYESSHKYGQVMKTKQNRTLC